MSNKHVLDRLADACEADRGIRLTADEVYTLLDEFAELELMREMDAMIHALELAEASGIPAPSLH